MRCPCPPGQPNRGRGRSRPRTRLRPRSARLLACSPVRSFARSLTRFSLLASRFALPASRFPLRASRLAKKSDHPLACTTCPTSLTCLLRNARVGEPLHPMDPSRLDSPCDRRRASFLTANSAKDEAACSGRSERAGRTNGAQSLPINCGGNARRHRNSTFHCRPMHASAIFMNVILAYYKPRVVPSQTLDPSSYYALFDRSIWRVSFKWLVLGEFFCLEHVPTSRYNVRYIFVRTN